MTLGNILLIFFLIFSCQGLDYHEKSFLSLSKSTPNYLSHTRLGKLILSFSQLKLHDGQFTDLYNALDTLLSSLQQQIDSENDTFKQASDVHDSAVSNLNDQITTVTTDLNNAQNLLDTELIPSKRLKENDINDVSQSIVDFQNQISDAQGQRATQQEENSQKILDLTEAINAIDEAMSILRGLSTDNQGVSFIQKRFDDVTQAQNLLRLSVSRVKHNFYVESLLQAISFLTEKSNFIDQDTLKRVLNLLKELRDSFDVEKKNLSDYDDQQQILYEGHVKSLEDSITAQQAALDLDNTQLNDLKSKQFIGFYNKFHRSSNFKGFLIFFLLL